jgi:toxin-antitoxin system PIN domain toxin
MIAVDTNLLVYAHRADSDWHERAVACVRELAESAAAWAIPWPCLHEFLAIATHPRIYDPPTPLEQAIDQADAWVESPSAVLISEHGEHWPQLRGLLVGSRVVGPRVHDARIAALCLSHGVRELWTADRDFSRFAALVTRNPLAG